MKRQKLSPKSTITQKNPNKSAFYVLFLIVGWYGTSISLSIYNARLFSHNRNNFEFPLLTTAIHMLLQYILATTTLFLLRPDLKPNKIPPSLYFLKVVPCGITTALDLGLSNSSLKSITISFYTMVKSSAPVFVLFFAFVFRLEQISLQLILAVVIICFGVGIMVGNEPKFDWMGYFQVQLATVISGFRWTLTQVLLNSTDAGIGNPLAASMILSPIIAISLVFGSLAVESIGELSQVPQLQTFSMGIELILGICGAGVLAFFMILFEYELISNTSVLTLSIAGICKEVLTIFSSVVIMKDTLTKNIIIGLIISLVGIAGICDLTKGYNYLRIKSKNNQADYEEVDIDEFELESFKND